MSQFCTQRIAELPNDPVVPTVRQGTQPKWPQDTPFRRTQLVVECGIFELLDEKRGLVLFAQERAEK